MPANEWIESLKFILVPLGIPVLTFVVRKVAVYLREPRIKETKEWLESKDGRIFVDDMMDDWRERSCNRKD